MLCSRIFPILGTIIVVQSILFGGHKFFCWITSRNSVNTLHHKIDPLLEAQKKHLKTIQAGSKSIKDCRAKNETKVPQSSKTLQVKYEAKNERVKVQGLEETSVLDQPTNTLGNREDIYIESVKYEVKEEKVEIQDLEKNAIIEEQTDTVENRKGFHDIHVIQVYPMDGSHLAEDSLSPIHQRHEVQVSVQLESVKYDTKDETIKIQGIKKGTNEIEGTNEKERTTENVENPLEARNVQVIQVKPINDYNTIEVLEESSVEEKDLTPQCLDPTLLTPSAILPSFKINNMRFNQDIVNNSIANFSLTFGLTCLIPLVFYFITSSEDPSTSFIQKYLGFTIYIFLCLFHPLQFFIQSKKLRSYLCSHFV